VVLRASVRHWFTGDRIKEWLGQTDTVASPSQPSELDNLIKRIEKLEAILSPADKWDKNSAEPKTLALRLLDLLANDDASPRSIAEWGARDFCEGYLNLLWDIHSDAGIMNKINLSPEDVDDEIWHYGKWKR
jgi:hypothetical protein